METSSQDIKLIDVSTQPAEPNFYDHVPEIIPIVLRAKGDIKALNKGYSIQTTAKLMEKSKITHAMIAGMSRPYKEVISNDRVNEYIQAYPDKFSGIVTVDLFNPV